MAQSERAMNTTPTLGQLQAEHFVMEPECIDWKGVIETFGGERSHPVTLEPTLGIDRPVRGDNGSELIAAVLQGALTTAPPPPPCVRRKPC